MADPRALHDGGAVGVVMMAREPDDFEGLEGEQANPLDLSDLPDDNATPHVAASQE